ncbi:pseudouridylate synthase, partial [Streptomyces sp. NPDC051987]
MRRKTAVPPSPLPQRQGVDPVRVRLPFSAEWDTVGAYLVARLSGAGPGVVEEMLDAGLVVGAHGHPRAAHPPHTPRPKRWLHPPKPPQVPEPI